MKIIKVPLLVLPFFWSCASVAQSGRADFGVTGLLDMPTARMQPDGTFGATYVRQDAADTFALTYQATPWLETSFRYHIQSPREELWNHYDRSYELKARLLEESGWYPEVAVGIRDLLGTGIYSAEYLVGSKSFGNLDMTLGLGWGRLAGRSTTGRNPFTYISSSFDERNAETGQGGELRGGDYFSGPDVGIFGGVQYDLPDWGLSLLAEYNSDVYEREVVQGNSIQLDSPWSFGVNWNVVEDISLGLSWQHGSEVSLRVTSALDSKSILPRVNGSLAATTEGDAVPSYTQQQAPSWYHRLASDAAKDGLWLNGVSVVDEDQVIIEYENDRYQIQTDAAERLIQLAEIHLPSEIRLITLVYSERTLRPFSIQYRRRNWDSLYDLATANGQIRSNMTFLPAPAQWQPDLETDVPNKINVFADIKPRFSFFDPDNPARYQFYLSLNAYRYLGNGWRAQGSLALNLLTNFDEITRQSDSVLPRVRSDFDKYLKQGKNSLRYLFIEKYGQLGRDTYYRGFAGYLEQMYAGVGAELLYRPFRSRMAYGLNIMEVRQRAYNGRLSLLDYQTTLGHLSFYWASPFYNYDVALHVGRYLAGDWGRPS